VHAGLLDVLHDAADHDALAVRDGVDVHLRGVRQKAVHEHRVRRRGHHRFAHVGAQRTHVVNDFHAPAAQHVGGPHQHRIADPLRDDLGLRSAARHAGRWALQPQVLEQGFEALPIFGAVDGVRRCAQDGHPIALQRHGQTQRRLTSELDDHALGLLRLHDLEHVFQGEWLEVEAIAGVVVRRDGFGIAVDHDRLEARLAQRKGRVHTAVVELDALSDPVGPATQDHDLAAVGGLRLALVLIGRVQVGRMRLELARAGVHPLVDGTQPPPVAQRANLVLAAVPQFREAAV
jgi:hypothetical protein